MEFEFPDVEAAEMSECHSSMMYLDGSGDAPDLPMSPAHPVCSKSVHTNFGYVSSTTLSHKHDEHVTPFYLVSIKPHLKNVVSLAGPQSAYT